MFIRFLHSKVSVPFSKIGLELAAVSNQECICSPVPRKFFISELKYFVSKLISGQKFFLKCLSKAWIFFKYFIFYPKSDQKLAKSRLFLARKKSPGGARPSPF